MQNSQIQSDVIKHKRKIIIKSETPDSHRVVEQLD